MKCPFYGITVVLSSILLSRGAITPHNVDVQEPFIITSPAQSDLSDAFGWSAVFHRIDASASNSDSLAEILNKTRVLVGAPRGTFPADLEDLLPAVNQTGLVYNCPIGTGSCEGVRGNTAVYIGTNLDDITNEVGDVPFRRDLFPQTYSEGRLFDQAPNAMFALTVDVGPTREQAEIKAEQLMGSYLFSSGGQVIACASSWDYYVIAGSGVSKTVRPLGICFVGNRQLEGFVTTAPCLVDDSPLCLAGISAPIANGNVNIGALGFSNARGSVYQRSASATTARTSFTRNNPTLNVDNYFGFEVATGYLTNSRTSGENEDVVVGAIRYAAPTNYGAVFLGLTNSAPVLAGDQMAENFGYSVALVDLNGDGYDEVVVGAPTFSSLESSNFLIERGRVFIYINLGTGAVNTTNPLIISGPYNRMRFGLKVVNAGDLDSDGISDLIVAAPYEQSNTSNSTGAIYVYYGNSNMEEFRNQEPQRIHADDIVQVVTDVTLLRSFGFSVSGRTDVDGNNHADIVVGGYEDQIVTMLRTRPFANVQVSFGSVPDVNLDTQVGFNVTITANYSSNDPMLIGARQFPYQLRETSGTSRLFFTRNDPTSSVFSGMLNFNGQQIATEIVTAYVDATGDPTQPYLLRLSLVDVNKPTASLSKTGKQILSLTSLPRFRLFGDPLLTVNISDLCNSDDCQSDVSVSASSKSITIVAGKDPNAMFLVRYDNIGLEEARNLQLVISDIPVSILGIPQVSTGTNNARIECGNVNGADGLSNVTCTLQQRLRSADSRNVTVSIPIVTTVGDERGFTIRVEVIIDMSGNNNDTNSSNNAVTIGFTVESISDISVSTDFPDARPQYTSVPPATITPTTSELGQQGRLTVTVGNTGPSTIQNSRVTIYFPARNPQITGNNYFLYPVALNPSLGMKSIMSGTVVMCDLQNIDPDCLDNGVNNTNCKTSQPNRKKRSGALTMEAKRMRRAAVAELSARSARLPRQTTSTSDLDCNTSPQECLKFVCNITKLIAESVDLLLDYSIDERFFSSQSSMEYRLTAVAEVEVLDEFQRIGDNKDNDRANASVTLVPPTPVDGGGPELYLAIILPAVFGLIILIIIVVLLYFFGFFRRKKKPGEDEELEPIAVQKQQPPPPEKGNNDGEVMTKV